MRCKKQLELVDRSCVNTEYKMIKDDYPIPIACTGMLNQVFSPPQDPEELQQECNKRVQSENPLTPTVRLSDVCPTFCNNDECCPIDQNFEFLMPNGDVKKCGGLLLRLTEDKTVEGRAALAEQCLAWLPEYDNGSEGTSVYVEEVCTGYCREGCEVIDCENKRPDQFMLSPSGDEEDIMYNCDDYLKDLESDARKDLCKVKISIWNVNKERMLKPQSIKKTCPLYCANRCRKSLAVIEGGGELPTLPPN